MNSSKTIWLVLGILALTAVGFTVLFTVPFRAIQCFSVPLPCYTVPQCTVFPSECQNPHQAVFPEPAPVLFCFSASFLLFSARFILLPQEATV